MSVDVVQYLGGVEVSSNGSSSASGGQTEIESAEAMSMTYFIQTYENRLNPEVNALTMFPLLTTSPETTVVLRCALPSCYSKTKHQLFISPNNNTT